MGGIAVPAMFGAVAVLYFALVRRVGGGLQKIFDEVDGVVEHVVVGAAHVDAELAAEFWAERGPVALQDVAEVVVFLPIGGDFGIDLDRRAHV